MKNEPKKMVNKLVFISSLCLAGIISFVIFSPMITPNNEVDSQTVKPSSAKQPSTIKADINLDSNQIEDERESNKIIETKPGDEKEVDSSFDFEVEDEKHEPNVTQVVENSPGSDEDREEHQSLFSLYDMNIFPEKSINDTFLKMVGSHYSNYVSTMKIFEKEHYNDEEAGDAIVTIRGKSNSGGDKWESIIIYDLRGLQYAAYIKGNSIFYHSNDPEYQNKLPAFIEVWKENFDTIPVEFLSSK
ncbi:hypothetical protein CJ195_14305 [Bacillus sp. UMB0899]|uniref:hypothetical protein n=1 Tax=Metabacillus schmidteae TaxID=2730405 RepID=UPI000C7FDB69|nr:hypothetical protein [Metabacillus schmidteae]PMC36604.1 hypothetical protein CJ195_14305 [Bacillus sp. UMB0899]